MNKIYKVVWNGILGHWVVTSELARRSGKVKSCQQTVNAVEELPVSPNTNGAKYKLLALATFLGLSGSSLNIAMAQNPNFVIRHQNDQIYYPDHEVPSRDGITRDSINGIIFDSSLTGQQDVTFEAPNAKLNNTRVRSAIQLHPQDVPEHIKHSLASLGLQTTYWGDGILFNTGQDDRYGRKIFLKGEDANDYVGTTYVKNNAYLYVGQDAEKDHSLLGHNNDLTISDFSVVGIYSQEEVHQLRFIAGDSARLSRDSQDPDRYFFAEIKQTGAEDGVRFYHIPNTPQGGVVHLTPKSSLVVNGETTFSGNNAFNVSISAYDAKLDLKQAATFDRGNIYLANNSQGVAEKNLQFSGHNSGLSLTDHSKLEVKGTLEKGNSSENNGYGYFTVKTGSELEIHQEAVIERGTLDINDGNEFRHDSGFPDHQRQPNQPVAGLKSNFSKMPAMVSSKHNIIFKGSDNRLNVTGSQLLVSENLIANDGLKMNALYGNISVKGDQGLVLGAKSDAVLLATKMGLSEWTIGDESLIFSGSNQIFVDHNMTLGEKSVWLDATYADGESLLLPNGDEKVARLHFVNDYAHHGLTYDEYLNVMNIST